METKIKEGFFHPRRFAQLLLRDLVGGYRSILIAMGAVAGYLIVMSVLTALGISTTNAGVSGFYQSFFIQLLYIGGLIVTSLAFREARQNGAALVYLMLPASAFEKLLSKLLSSSVGYALGSLVFFTAAAAASEGVTRLLFGFGHGFFSPFTAEVWTAIGYYLIVQSVFLAGSIWFRKMSFMKTVLWLMVFAVGCAIILAVAARILLADDLRALGIQMSGISVQGNNLNFDPQKLLAEGTPAWRGLMVFCRIAQVLFYGFLAPVGWLAAFFKLKETEA
jgi:hypothetical protein